MTTTTIHVLQIFTTQSPDLLAECEALMQELLRREEVDPSVRDAAVSADAQLGMVEIEVTADGRDERDAELAATSRITAAVSTIAQLITPDDDRVLRDHALTQRDRSVQLLTA